VFFYINGCGWDYELMKHSVANMGYYFDWIGISFSYYSFFFSSPNLLHCGRIEQSAGQLAFLGGVADGNGGPGRA
jgi:hypothetical protein